MTQGEGRKTWLTGYLNDGSVNALSGGLFFFKKSLGAFKGVFAYPIVRRWSFPSFCEALAAAL